MNHDRREYRGQHRDKSRVILVVSPPRRPALTREEQQRRNRESWDVELILKNCANDRPGDDE
ncbi:hypothetical protein [Caballeronia sp. LjRoot31]|uniref:hypothetical protein n=1 Tax=Caballeronia sp. LjRoot31 TaxID=3342324 RepID=UPI003F4FA9B6